MAERYVPQATRVEVAGRTLKLTSLDKLLFPSTETTKGEVLSYYARVAPVMLPLLGRRAVTRIRWPHGVEGPMFFEKNLPSGAPTLQLMNGAAKRLAELTPDGHEAHIHLTLTDDHPWAQAFVVIEARPR